MSAEQGWLIDCAEIERTENVFMHKLPQAMAMSKEEKLRILLGQ